MGCASSTKAAGAYEAEEEDGGGATTKHATRPASSSSSSKRRSDGGGGGGTHRRSRSADKADYGAGQRSGSGGGSGSRDSSRTKQGGHHRRSRSASKERESKRDRDRDRGPGGASSADPDQPRGSFSESLSASGSSGGGNGGGSSIASAQQDWQSRAALLASSSAHETAAAGVEFDDWQRGMLDILEEQSIQAYDMDMSQLQQGEGATTCQGRRYSNSLLGFSSQSYAPFLADSPAMATGTGRHGRAPLGGGRNPSAFSFGSLSALDGFTAGSGSAHGSHPPVPAHPTILVVDEHPSTRAIISKWLTNSKFTEISCATGDQAQSILAPPADHPQPAHTVDVIVADVNVLVEQGSDASGSGSTSGAPMLLLDWVINAAPAIASIPVIVLSSNLPSQGLERLLRRGAWDALHKPLNRAVFLNALATVFNTRRQKVFVERLRAKGDEYKERYMSRAKLVYNSSASFKTQQSQQPQQHPLAPPSKSAHASATSSAAPSMPTTPLFANQAALVTQQQQQQQQQQATPPSQSGRLQLPGNNLSGGSSGSGSGSSVSQPITVLVVETDPTIIANLTDWIQTSSVRLRVVHTLAEAVTLLRESQKQAVMAASSHSPHMSAPQGSGRVHRLTGHRSMSNARSTSPGPTGTSPVFAAAPSPFLALAPTSATAALSSAAATASTASVSMTATTATDESVPASTLGAPPSFSSTSLSVANGEGGTAGVGAGAAPVAPEIGTRSSGSTKDLPLLPPSAVSAPSLPAASAAPRFSLPGAVPSSPLQQPASPVPWHSRLSPLPPYGGAAAGFGIELIIVNHDMLIPPEVSAELVGMGTTDPGAAAVAAPPTVGTGTESSDEESGDEGLAAVASSAAGAGLANPGATAAAPRTARTTVFMSSGLAASQILVDLTLQPVLGKRRKLPVVCMCDVDGPSPVGMALLKHVALTIFNRPLSQGLVNKKMSLLLELIEQNRLGLMLARRANMYKGLLAQLQSHAHEGVGPAGGDMLENGLDEHAGAAASSSLPHTPGRRGVHGEFRSRLLSVEREHRMRSAQGTHGSPTRGPINEKRRGSVARGGGSTPPSPLPGAPQPHYPSFMITPDLGPGIGSDSAAVMSAAAAAAAASAGAASAHAPSVPPSLALNTNLSLRAPMHRSYNAASTDSSSNSGGFELPPALGTRSGRQHSDGSSGSSSLLAPYASSRAMVSSSTLHAAESQALHAPPRTNTPPIAVHRPVLRIRTDSANV